MPASSSECVTFCNNLKIIGMDCDVKITGKLKSFSKEWNADNAGFQAQIFFSNSYSPIQSIKRICVPEVKGRL
jgi:hypothetical protein